MFSILTLLLCTEQKYVYSMMLKKKKENKQVHFNTLNVKGTGLFKRSLVAASSLQKHRKSTKKIILISNLTCNNSLTSLTDDKSSVKDISILASKHQVYANNTRKCSPKKKLNFPFYSIKSVTVSISLTARTNNHCLNPFVK